MYFVTNSYTLKNVARYLFLNYKSWNYNYLYLYKNCLRKRHLLVKIKVGLKSNFKVLKKSVDFLLDFYVEIK